MKFCRIITIGDFQILLEKEQDDSKLSPFIVRATTVVEAGKMAISFTFDTEERQQKMFDNYDGKSLIEEIKPFL